MILETQASPDPCNISESGNNLVEENREKLKACVDNKVEAFSKNVFGSLQASGSSQIIEYLIKVGIEYIDALYNKRNEETKALIKDIWIDNYPYMERQFQEHKFDATNIIPTIRAVLSDREMGNVFEKLLIVADVMAKMEEHFKSNEAILSQLRSELTSLHNRGLYQRTIINLPSEKMSAAAVSRGDLKIEVDVSKPLIVAGEEFSVFVSITNPFEVPIVIHKVETMIPIELKAISVIKESSEKYTGVAEGFATIDIEQLSKNLSPAPYVLQPDDRICKQIVLKTEGNFLKWLNFTPIKLLLEIQVQYGVDYREHLDTVKTEVDIQVGLKAIMVGAIVGGLVGGLVSVLSKSEHPDFWKGFSYVAIAIVFSAMAVVAFARKTGVQKIVSIEDFYGGLLIGFVVGFQGPEYFWNDIMGGAGTPLQTANSLIDNNTAGNATKEAITFLANATNNTTKIGL